MPVFFITPDQVHDHSVTLSGPLVTHLQGSLRVKLGEALRLVEPGRRLLHVSVTHIDRRRVQGQVLREEPAPPPRAPRLVLGQAILKGDHMDWVIQKATELGVERLIPLVTEQVVVRPRADRILNQVERWQRIAWEAAQQSERWNVPEVATPCDLVRFLSEQADQPYRLILLERDGRETLREIALPSSPADRITLLVGPEGGWRETEAAEALARGFVPIGLGSRILRAETAALSAVAVLQSRLGELG